MDMTAEDDKENAPMELEKETPKVTGLLLVFLLLLLLLLLLFLFSFLDAKYLYNRPASHFFLVPSLSHCMFCIFRLFSSFLWK